VPPFSKVTGATLAELIDYAYTFCAGATPGTYPPPFPTGIPVGYTIVALAQATDDFWGYSNPQFYGFVAVAAGQIVIAIRGTGDITEWLIDFEFPLTQFSQIPGAGYVEEGFSSVFSTLEFVDVNGNSFDLIGYLNGALKSNPRTQIIIEGHSLGGAIVSMLALTTVYQNAALKNATTVYTLASPAPGDTTFANFYNSNAPLTYRIWNPWDLVTHTPPSALGYLPVAGAGVKLEPTIDQLEQYDFLSVDCNHSLMTYQWLLDNAFPLLPSCEWGLPAVQPQVSRAAKLETAVAHMRARTLSEPRKILR
jgi:hypothetical protein